MQKHPEHCYCHLSLYTWLEIRLKGLLRKLIHSVFLPVNFPSFDKKRQFDDDDDCSRADFGSLRFSPIKSMSHHS